jgi:hypothetical protein
MVERGASHLNALCVVAARLAERTWAVMHCGMSCVICDIDGAPMTTDQAKKIIAESVDFARTRPHPLDKDHLRELWRVPAMGMVCVAVPWAGLDIDAIPRRVRDGRPGVCSAGFPGR